MSVKNDSDDTAYIVELLDAENIYTLTQVCEICQTTQSVVRDYVEHNVIEPVEMGNSMEFKQQHLDRLLKGIRLQRDLELNNAGVALALDLLETIDQLKLELRKLQQ